MTKKENDLLLRELGFLMKMKDYAEEKYKKPKKSLDHRTYKKLSLITDGLINECVDLLVASEPPKKIGAVTKYHYTQKQKKEVMAKAKQKGYTK